MPPSKGQKAIVVALHLLSTIRRYKGSKKYMKGLHKIHFPRGEGGEVKGRSYGGLKCRVPCSFFVSAKYQLIRETILKIPLKGEGVNYLLINPWLNPYKCDIIFVFNAYLSIYLNVFLIDKDRHMRHIWSPLTESQNTLNFWLSQFLKMKTKSVSKNEIRPIRKYFYWNCYLLQNW